jgi:hypothetical protein
LYEPAFVVEAFHSHTENYAVRLFLAVNGHSTVSFALCGVPIGMIAIGIGEYFRDLVRVCFGLLEAQDVW